MSLIVNLFGILGILTTVIVYQQKENKNLLFWKITTDLVWIVHYAANGNYSVVAITLVAILRSFVLLNAEKHAWARRRWWLAVFIACSLVFSLIAWKDWTSLLTLFSSLLCIVAYWVRIPRLTRLISIPGAALFLANIVINFSFWGFISETFLLVSAIVGFIRLDLPYYRDKARQRRQKA